MVTTAPPAPVSEARIVRVRVALWAVVLGAVSGLSCAGVRWTFGFLQWVFVRHRGSLPAAAASLSPGLRIAVPALGALLAMAVVWIERRWGFAGTFEDYVEIVRLRQQSISFVPTLWRTISSAYSIATGAAVGREGSMIQFSASVAGTFAQRFGADSRSLPLFVACGAAAAVAAAYQAPIAGVFFAIEIVIGSWSWAEIPPLVLAAFAGWLAGRPLAEPGPLFPPMFAKAIQPGFGLWDNAIWAVGITAVIGAISPLYQRWVRAFRFAAKWPLPLLWSGLAVGLLSTIQPEVWGNGDVALTHVLQSATLRSVVLILLLRLVATAFCVGTGTVGGVFTPTVFTGAALGWIGGYMMRAPEPVLLAVVGLSSLLGAVTKAPLMASFMAVELTGEWRLWPFLLVLTLFANAISSNLSSQLLYGIASTTPAGKQQPA
jgi:chloride channel protein, CIC family